MTTQPDRLEDQLFLAMLRLSREGAGPQFDLVSICNEQGISASPQQLIAFTSDNDGSRGRKDNGLKFVRFTPNAEGLRHALRLEEARRPRTLKDWVNSITRSDLIAFGALVVSVIALFKD